jgi:hypothetical protein
VITRKNDTLINIIIVINQVIEHDMRKKKHSINTIIMIIYFTKSFSGSLIT